MEKWTEIHKLRGKYETFVSLTVSRQSSTQYAKSMESFFQRFPDKDDPRQFSRADVEDYRIQKLREGMSPVTINYHCVVLRGFWKWMMDLEVVTWNPFAQIKRLKTKEPARVSMAIPEQQQLWKGCYSAMDKVLVALSLYTGLRGETLCQLTRSMVEFGTSRLVIPGVIMKAGRNHEIPIPSFLLLLLGDLPEGLIFKGYADNAAQISYRFTQICRRAGLKYKGIRIARRTFATTLLRSGADIKIVQDLLGHKSLLTTSRYVTPADSATVRKALEGLPLPEESIVS